jgi:hypothetical protein
MNPLPLTLKETLFQILITMLAVFIVFHFNIRAFNYDWLVFSNGVSLIWLPAFVKIISVMLFGWRGAIGLGLGCISVMDTDRSIEILALNVVNWTILPLLAIQLSLQMFKVPSTLAGIRHWHIIVVAGIEGALYALTQTILYVMNTPGTNIVDTISGLFIGEVTGTVIVVYTGSLLLRAWQHNLGARLKKQTNV